MVIKITLEYLEGSQSMFGNTKKAQNAVKSTFCAFAICVILND